MSFRRPQRASRKGRDAILPLLVFAAICFAAVGCAALNEVAGDLIVLSDNGAWSWFEDERSIVDTTAAGAFAALGMSLPEPSSWAMLTLGGVLTIVAQGNRVV